jgi:hypothetical protein
MASESDTEKMKRDFKISFFDKELRALIKQGQETIEARYGISMEIGELRPEHVCLNRYLSIYNKTKPEEHFEYFENLYNRKRADILNCLEDDRWIKNGRLFIQWGEGMQDMPTVCRQIKICLSDIFSMACDVQLKAEKSLDGIDEKFAQAAGGKDLIRPNILLLHLLRIFYCLHDGSDKNDLGRIVAKLETDLGIKNKTSLNEPWKVTPSVSSAKSGLSGLFSMATGMMKNFGIEPPAGMKEPTEEEITTVISSVFNNEATQNAIQGMFTSLQGCNDISSAISTVVKNVTDPATMEAIQGSVNQTAQFAAPSDQI